VNRRKFLQFLGAGVGAAAVAAVTPGAVKFFLPPKGGWKLNAWTWTTKDHYLALDEFEDRILRPAIDRIATKIETNARLQVGDIITFDSVYARSVSHLPPGAPLPLKQFIVTSVGDSRGWKL
jgi:hypothetical protein